MLNTGLLEIIVLCLKIIAYSSNAQAADIDMLKDGHYQGSISYQIIQKKMHVSFTQKKKKTRLMTVSTIDNGLYSVQLNKEKPFQLDLAPYYTKLDWKNLTTSNTKIKTKHKIWLRFTASPKNLYVNYGKWTFVIHKNLLYGTPLKK